MQSRARFIIVCGLFLVAFATGCGGAANQDESTLRVHTGEIFGVVAIGDYGVGDEEQQALGDSIRRYAALNEVDLLLTLGDNWYGKTIEAFHRAWEESFGWLPEEGIEVAGSIGNHDNDIQAGARYQFDTLNMPGPYYTREFGDVEFFVLDSNEIDAQQTAWLENALKNSTAGWKIAVAHHPPYTCGGHHPDDDIIREWVPLFERYDVQLMLAGHDHTYQRFGQKRGVTYVVSGGGGMKLYPITKCRPEIPPRIIAQSRYHFLYVAIARESITVRSVGLDDHLRLDGVVVDAFTLNRVANPASARAAGRRGELSDALDAGLPLLLGSFVIGGMLGAFGLVWRRRDVVAVAMAIPVAGTLGVLAVGWLL